MQNKRTIHVFIASPGDIPAERRAFKETIDELNGGFGDGAGAEFVALGWEDTLATTGRRPQSAINNDVDRCDVFVLAMWRRWGQPAPDAEPYSSYTEEEFHRALDRWNKTRAPEIFVFFKDIDPGQMADPGPQLAKVLGFRKSMEESRKVLFRHFADDGQFKEEVNKHLRAYVKGKLPKPDAPREAVILPLAYIREVEKAREAAKAEAVRADAADEKAQALAARGEELALTLAEQAAKAALEGRVEEARQTFAKAAEVTTNLRVLYLLFEFYFRTGDLSAAEDALERWLSIIGPNDQTSDTAAALGNLGLIYRTRGDMDRAEQMHLKSLAIEEKLGRQEGMAVDYGNLGLIYQSRGELDRAEQMHLKSLAISEKLGQQEGMANQYGNLGLIYLTRGDLDRAEEMHLKSLAIDEKFGRQEGMAVNYGNLGLIYLTRGDLDRAEEMHLKSLAIDEKLGRQGGMANQYGNLGLIYQTRGDLDRAEEMLRKSLAINEKLGRQEGMANQYANLGPIYRTRSNLPLARELLTKARDLYAKIGVPLRVKQMQDRLDAL